MLSKILKIIILHLTVIQKILQIKKYSTFYYLKINLTLGIIKKKK